MLRIISNYINRIDYKGELVSNLPALKALQYAHLLHVPFENLDIHYGKIIDLANTYDKVVRQGRGGFCYELNGLFYTLLKNIGFDAKIISARVYDPKKQSFGKEYDHLTIIVNLNQIEYLVDVGFGEFTFYPLKIELGIIQTDPRGSFIIEVFDEKYLKVSKIVGKEKTIEYIFSLKERLVDEFLEMCHYHQTSPDSHFTKQKLITRPTKDGRITLAGNTLKITKNGVVLEERKFAIKEFGMYLLEKFQIEEPK